MIGTTSDPTQALSKSGVNKPQPRSHAQPTAPLVMDVLGAQPHPLVSLICQRLLSSYNGRVGGELTRMGFKTLLSWSFAETVGLD